MADSKVTYICVKGCSVDGKGIEVGAELPAKLEERVKKRLIGMGRFAPADSDVARAALEKAGAGKGRKTTKATDLPGA